MLTDRESSVGGETMYAAVVHELGAVPRYERFAAPSDTDGAVVVTVAAAALKPSDRLAAAGVHYAPRVLPIVAGLDGVGRLADGTRVAFLIPEQPYGGMAEMTLVGRGRWLLVPDGVDDAVAAALLNPGLAAWKTIAWEGEVTAGQCVLVLGATSTAGRIAAQLAVRAGAQVVVAGRSEPILEELLSLGADSAVRLDGPADRVVAALAAAGPYDLIADFVWGTPAEAVFAALESSGAGPERTRYILVGMAAGERATLPAMTLRRAPVQILGSGTSRDLSIEQSWIGFADLVQEVTVGRIGLDVEAVPLADVGTHWTQPSNRSRIVFVP